MIAEYNPFESGITGFHALNILLAMATSVLLFLIFIKTRYLFIKPSVWLLTVCHVLVQWPAALFFGYYQSWLPRPIEFSALSQGTIIFGLVLTISLFRPTAKLAWARLGVKGVTNSPIGISPDILAISILAVVNVVAIGLYLAEVPLQCTGLYSLVTSPDVLPLAREISLKLVKPALPRYALTLASSSVVPLMTGLLVMQIIKHGRTQSLGATLSCLSCLIAAWLLADLTGAKGIFVSLSLVVTFTFLWWRRISVNPLVVAIALICSLLPAIAITTVIEAAPFRGRGSYDINFCLHVVSTPGLSGGNLKIESESQALLENRKSLLESLVIKQDKAIASSFDDEKSHQREGLKYLEILKDNIMSVFYRAAVVPLQTGGWFVHHEQIRGPIGIGGIPRIAGLLGVPVVDAPNLIGRTYGPVYYGHEVSPTISASTSFIFANYAYFGPMAIAVNIVLILLVDIALFAFVRIDALLLVPLLGALTPVSFKFLESDYLTVWLTHGYGVMLLLALALTFSLKYCPLRAAVEGKA